MRVSRGRVVGLRGAWCLRIVKKTINVMLSLEDERDAWVIYGNLHVLNLGGVPESKDMRPGEQRHVCAAVVGRANGDTCSLLHLE